jgi:hypothetical protein
MLYQKFDGSLMTQNANSYAGWVSNYETNAVYKGQYWELEEDSSFPDYPEQEHVVECNMKR